MVRRSALGALSTHDLASTEIVTDSKLNGLLMHMESESPNDPLDFDYRLKPGPATHSNALAILRMIGIEEALADGSA